jgi:hypothetical protein
MQIQTNVNREYFDSLETLYDSAHKLNVAFMRQRWAAGVIEAPTEDSPLGQFHMALNHATAVFNKLYGQHYEVKREDPNAAQ